jgi:hypothetical protein
MIQIEENAANQGSDENNFLSFVPFCGNFSSFWFGNRSHSHHLDPTLSRLETNMQPPRARARAQAGPTQPASATVANQANRLLVIQCANHTIKTPSGGKCSVVFTSHLTRFKHTEFITRGTFLALVPLN